MAELKTKEVMVNLPQEVSMPRFSNLIAAAHSKQRGEVILDFIFIDDRLKNKEGKILGNTVSKIAITPNTAKELIKLLTKLIGKK
jgi:hypothetical protein